MPLIELDSRQEHILQAVICEHIRTAEPVGSLALLQRYELGCSPATIRHEMARLEDAGYLGHPHTSAGRIPMQSAYRFYVDGLLRHKPTPLPEAASIREQYDTERDTDQLLADTAHLLSHLTRHTALVLAPQLRSSVLKYLQLVPVSDRSIMVVVLTCNGRVAHRVIEFDRGVQPADAERWTNLLNDRLRGKTLEEVSNDRLEGWGDPRDVELVSSVVNTVKQAAGEENRVWCEGTANLCAQPEFRDADKLRRVLECIEEEKAIAELMAKTLSGAPIQVSLGTELDWPGAPDCSMVTASYYLGQLPVGSLGILGPTRLPYDRLIAVVSLVAECFSSRLSVLHGGT